MDAAKATTSDPVLKTLDRLIPDLEALYKDVHAHPELSMQETRTTGLAAGRLRAAGYEVAWPVGRYANPPSYSTKPARKYARTTKRRHARP
jgi:metal-dependent amidase/aminoacylase/carboxypeptidase family protein